MDGPEVLISHYASLAFYTRIAALTFVGAIVGAMDVERLKDPQIECLVGVGILLVIAALAEFNRRYTRAYVAAVHAACHPGASEVIDNTAASVRWCTFRNLNGLTIDEVQMRMLLSWITYLPGVGLGAYFLWSCDSLTRALTSVLLALGVIAWILWLALRPYLVNDVKKPRTTGI